MRVATQHSLRLRNADSIEHARCFAACLLAAVIAAFLAAPRRAHAAEPVVEIGERLELFVDQHLIESLRGARLVLHPPRPAEVALKTDAPWEGKDSAYFTVF